MGTLHYDRAVAFGLVDRIVPETASTTGFQEGPPKDLNADGQLSIQMRIIAFHGGCQHLITDALSQSTSG